MSETNFIKFPTTGEASAATDSKQSKLLYLQKKICQRFQAKIPN